MQLAKVAGAHTGAFSTQRVFVHRLSDPVSVTHSQPVRAIAARDRLKRRFLKRILPFVALFFALAFQLLIRVQMIHAGYRVHELRRQALGYDNELRELNAKLAVSTCPKTLISRAQSELGLSITPPQRIRTL